MIFLETIYCIILILMKGISVKCVIVIFVGMKKFRFDWKTVPL